MPAEVRVAAPVNWTAKPNLFSELATDGDFGLSVQPQCSLLSIAQRFRFPRMHVVGSWANKGNEASPYSTLCRLTFLATCLPMATPTSPVVKTASSGCVGDTIGLARVKADFRRSRAASRRSA
jgi:hypothetical protein